MDEIEMTAASVERLLAKLRAFAEDLDEDERCAFAALVGPGVAMAYADKTEVSGFAMTWSRQTLPDHLAQSMRHHNIRVEGL